LEALNKMPLNKAPLNQLESFSHHQCLVELKKKIPNLLRNRRMQKLKTKQNLET
jgi:hypothetical protein